VAAADHRPPAVLTNEKFVAVGNAVVAVGQGIDHEGGYEPDTATLVALTKWLELNVADLEPEQRPSPDSSSLTDVAMHLHALPNITKEDAEEMIAVVKALYDSKRKRSRRGDLDGVARGAHAIFKSRAVQRAAGCSAHRALTPGKPSIAGERPGSHLRHRRMVPGPTKRSPRMHISPYSRN
jgi:hypothetical protein